MTYLKTDTSLYLYVAGFSTEKVHLGTTTHTNNITKPSSMVVSFKRIVWEGY